MFSHRRNGIPYLAVHILNQTPVLTPPPAFWTGLFIASGISVVLWVVAFYLLGGL